MENDIQKKQRTVIFAAEGGHAAVQTLGALVEQHLAGLQYHLSDKHLAGLQYHLSDRPHTDLAALET